MSLLWPLILSGQLAFNIKNIEGVNTPYDDVACSFRDDKLYFISSDKQDYLNDGSWNEHSVFSIQSALMMGDLSHFQNPKRVFSEQIPTDQGTWTYDPADSTCYFSASQTRHLSTSFLTIFESKWDGKKWSNPKPLPFCLSTNHFTHPFFDPETKLLVFSSNRPGGQGGMDIWFSYKIPGGWTEPVNPGFPLNTPKKELFPSIYQNDIYYSSNGIVNDVGFDLFVSKGDQQWSNSIQLPSPINSSHDDIMLFFASSDRAFLSSNRPGGSGGDDIYLIEKVINKKDACPYTARLDYMGNPLAGAQVTVFNDLKEIITKQVTDSSGFISLKELSFHAFYKMKIEGVNTAWFRDMTLSIMDEWGRVVRVLRVNDDGSVVLELLPFDYSEITLLNNPDESILQLSISGQVYEKKEGDIGKGEVVSIVDEEGHIVALASTNEKGKFRFDHLAPAMQYRFRLSEKSKANNIVVTDAGKSIVLPVLRAEAVYRRTTSENVIELIDENNRRIFIRSSDLFVVNRIYFEYNSAELSEEARGQLNQLATIMKANPRIKIELRSHTDANGDESFNDVLSRKRADRATLFLVSKGISRNRITAVGVGEREPLVNCVECSDEENALNRRTEIKLLAH